MTLPMLIQGLGVARAMARASSMPLPPGSGPDTEPADRHLPSLSWIGPDTGLHYTSQEERLQRFEAQACLPPSLHNHLHLTAQLVCTATGRSSAASIWHVMRLMHACMYMCITIWPRAADMCQWLGFM